MKTYTIDFNNSHVVSVYPEEESGKGGRVYDPQTISFAGLEWQSGIFVEPHRRSHSRW